jgi:hypothetical protein
MHEFIAKHRDKIAGMLSGFDRLVFRGTLRRLSYVDGMRHYLAANGVLLKDFGSHVEQASKRLKDASLSLAKQLNRPHRFLDSPKDSKEEIAQEIVAKEGIGEGLICVLTSIEPCRSYDIHHNRETKKLELVSRYRKCLFIYQYWMHPQFGFMNARIQTWFPFPIQICMNGRMWLRRQMDRAGIRYAAADNCFPWIGDWSKAQRLMDQQLRTNWPKALEPIARKLNPAHGEMFKKYPVSHYWSTYQSEWAIDTVFQKAEELRRLFPRLVHHGITTFSCTDVMRYLGKPILLSGEVPRRFAGDVVSDIKHREEGARIKHMINGNSVKLYDKAYTMPGSVLRAETTVHNGSDFRVYRPKEGDPNGKKSWRRMRRGIADLNRRAEVSRKSAERYLNAYANVEDETTLEELIHKLGQPAYLNDHRVRALRPFGDDSELLHAISRGEFMINGLRNRDLQAILFPSAPTSTEEARRRSAWVSRQLRLLRAHGLITKINGTHRYQLTTSGRKITTAILSALRATIRQLTPIAA